LPSDESAAVVGAFDVADAGSTTAGNGKAGYHGVANNSSPAPAPGYSGTLAKGRSKRSSAAAGRENPFDVLTDGQLVEAVATQGLLVPDVLEPANPARLAPTPGAETTPSRPVNAAGGPTQGGPADPEAALAFHVPDLLTALSPSLVVVDVGSGEGGGGLHWSASDPAAPVTSAAFAGNILTNSDIPIDDAAGNAPAASGGVSVGAVANGVAAVPEPASLLLLGGGLVIAGARQWKRRTHGRRAN
jgi:hypothetical protein